MKKWYFSKTIIIAIIQAIIGIILVIGNYYPEIGVLAMAKSILDVILRAITNLPVDILQNKDSEIEETLRGEEAEE